MKRRLSAILLLLTVGMLLTGCTMTTVDQMYAPPRRSQEYNDLQIAIDGAMDGLSYCAPLSGENQQTVQTADLDGDGEEEYLIFAKSAGEKPLQILIFDQVEGSFYLRERIASLGAAFEMVEYADVDGCPGMEILVGRQVSNQLLRSVSVYSFVDGKAQQLMATGYSKVVAVDLDQNGQTELLVITPGETDADHGAAALYRWEHGTIFRSEEANLSEPADQIKRIMVSTLQGGTPAVYVASAVDESAIITDVFALKNEKFTNISFSNESGTSVQTLRNYYVYADDIDHDGVLELPSLMTMKSRNLLDVTYYLIRWYAMDSEGEEVDKMYTFHNFDGGWYLQLQPEWAPRIMVTNDSGSYQFFLWDEEFQDCEKMLTIYAFTGDDRDAAAVADNRFVLHKMDGVVYSAKLEAASARLWTNREILTENFHMIRRDWKTGET